MLGVAKGTVGNWESPNQPAKPRSLKLIQKIAVLLDVSPSFLLFGEDKAKPQMVLNEDVIAYGTMLEELPDETREPLKKLIRENHHYAKATKKPAAKRKGTQEPRGILRAILEEVVTQAESMPASTSTPPAHGSAKPSVQGKGAKRADEDHHSKSNS